MTNLFNFQDLLVWQKSIDFAQKVILLIDELDTPRKHYRLIEQLESAVTSIPMNIAEGKGRFSVKEFIRFLYIARGSLFETITLIILFEKLKWISENKFAELQKDAEEISKMLNALIKGVKKIADSSN